MATKKIIKSIDINASRENVWNSLFMPESFKQWGAEFSQGTEVITTWEEGSKVIFKDASNSGLVGTIIKNVPQEIMVIEYYGELKDDKEDAESPYAQEVKGAMETYILTEKEGRVYLAIECDMSEKYFDMMSEAWDRALVKIKTLAEEV